MKGRSHLLLTGAAYAALALHPLSTPFGALAAPKLLPSLLPGGMVEVVVGALAASFVGLLPDVDKSGSKAARLGGWPTRILAWFVQLFLGHRGALHSLPALLLVWQCGRWAETALGVGGLAATAAFGWGAHLLLDAMTAGGIPLLWPLPLKLRLPPGVHTRGALEGALMLALLGLCGWWGGLF
jgi:inner membrane protein